MASRRLLTLLRPSVQCFRDGTPKTSIVGFQNCRQIYTLDDPPKLTKQTVPGDQVEKFKHSRFPFEKDGRISFVEPDRGDQNKNPYNPNLYPEEIRYGDPLAELSPLERNLGMDIVNRVNTQIAEETHGRLFAVIHMGGFQYRVTDGDIIMLLGTYHLGIGEKIKVEKVLAVGSNDFTLLGRPMLDRTLVDIDATCIEKSQSYPLVYFIHIKPIPLRIRRFRREAQTMIRINKITFKRQLNAPANMEDVVHNIH